MSAEYQRAEACDYSRDKSSDNKNWSRYDPLIYKKQNFHIAKLIKKHISHIPLRLKVLNGTA